MVASSTRSSEGMKATVCGWTSPNPPETCGPGLAAVGAAEDPEVGRRHHDVDVVGGDGERGDVVGDAESRPGPGAAAVAAAQQPLRGRRDQVARWQGQDVLHARMHVDAVDDGGDARPVARLGIGDEDAVVRPGQRLPAEQREGQHLASFEPGAETAPRAARTRRREHAAVTPVAPDAGQHAPAEAVEDHLATRTARRSRRWRRARSGRRRCCAPPPRRPSPAA